MKLKSILLFISIVIIQNKSIGQQAIFGGQEIKSPVVHEDKTVSFSFFAPNADSVQITGDFLAKRKIKTPYGSMEAAGKVDMTKDEKGIWTFSTSALEPELYSYSFIMDGVRINDPNNPFVLRDVATLTNIFIVSGGRADLYRVNDIPHGTVSKRWYNSPGLEIDRRLTIYTPPAYESNKEKYPVLYLLHGAGGDENAWTELGRSAQIIDNLINQGKARPMIVVMPNANVLQDAAPGEGRDGFYKPELMVPRTMDGTFESGFMDIVNFVEGNYRVLDGKQNRAIAGLSMGGFHALHISRYYQNSFNYIGLFSAAIMPGEGVNSDVYSDMEGTLLKQKENGYELYWIAIGKSDFLYESNSDFRKKLDELEMEYIYRESDGGHIWKNWRIYLSEFVVKLF